MERHLLIILLSLFVYCNSYSQILIPTYSNVDYVGKNAANQKMDIYIPPGLTSPAPVIVFIHGGGWSNGSKGTANTSYFQLSYNSGFICADINYRLSTDSVWPAQIEDCKTAIRFLKANSKIYNIDICRFGVIGESAGAHLGSMLGTTGGVTALEGLFQGSTGETSRVQAVVDLYGPNDFLKEDGYYPASCGTSGYIHEFNSFETHLLGIDLLHHFPALVETANPMSYITPDDAHFFIIHGGGDCIVPSYQSQILDSALTSKGIPADTFIVVAGQSHGSPYFSDNIRATMYNKFFLKHLSTPCSSTGLSNPEMKKITVYPNPASSVLNIVLPAIFNFTAEIMNVFGKTVLKLENQKTIDISGLPGGMYFLRIHGEDNFYAQKFIKL